MELIVRTFLRTGGEDRTSNNPAYPRFWKEKKMPELICILSRVPTAMPH